MPEGKSKTVSRSPLFIFFYFKFFPRPSASLQSNLLHFQDRLTNEFSLV
ncbi:hypothetical protein PNI0427_01231 [Streptococcus pneumoniae PNI0427]|nr:hypothetical protein PNI0010_00704 [Streptococcus pneumoniae PNI0010]ELU81794.1 hypothetical protein PNI0009_00810 [Streptococcus pneumoniae PNI0009]ELU89878.1 hypothetical protein PNI0360_00448 [Streptococcus pneumoniae PNI0360]ELU89932.1 hypothetical protein PNI0427_01231 [Streptococcus pneumoniae PNI0427]